MALGEFALPDPTQTVFAEQDVEGLAELKKFAVRENLDADSMSSLIRSFGTTAERLAVWQVEAMTKHLARTRGLGDTAARLEAARFAPAQTDMFLFLIQKLWTRHFAAAIHRLTTETILRRGVSDDDQQFPLTCAVGFAWVINFQEHTKDYPLEDLAAFARSFHDQAADIVNIHGGRVVNNTGDFILFVAAHPEMGVEIALKLAGMHGPDFTAHVHVGLVWSRVLSVYGDIYGPGVNLAAALSREAEADTVLTDPDTAQALRRVPGLTFTELPEVELKGIGPVTPVRIDPTP